MAEKEDLPLRDRRTEYPIPGGDVFRLLDEEGDEAGMFCEPFFGDFQKALHDFVPYKLQPLHLMSEPACCRLYLELKNADMRNLDTYKRYVFLESLLEKTASEATRFILEEEKPCDDCFFYDDDYYHDTESLVYSLQEDEAEEGEFPLTLRLTKLAHPAPPAVKNLVREMLDMLETDGVCCFERLANYCIQEYIDSYFSMVDSDQEHLSRPGTLADSIAIFYIKNEKALRSLNSRTLSEKDVNSLVGLEKLQEALDVFAIDNASLGWNFCVESGKTETLTWEEYLSYD